jgi:pimeloyl-ACP methyl ester carboxylesterase
MALGALLPALLLAISPASSAGSSLSFIPCPGSATLSCTSLSVPVERSGGIQGTLSLSVERKQAGATPSRDAVVALAGGPGQAALPLSEFIAQAIAPALGSRDLLVFDQRGTGTSDPLSCPGLESFTPSETVTQVFERCAGQIGPVRGAYTTEESVEDIEALRVAGGYEKLVLYGTSYGTKVALEYAERYPQYVEALVLDSVVPPEGWEPLHISSFQAITPVLDELCEKRACAGITSNPVADIARLVAEMQKRALSGSVYDGSGKRHSATLSSAGLLDILEAGDLNPALRALLPAAVKSALENDPDPLLRLNLLAEGEIPNVPDEHVVTESSQVDEALYWSTLCEESPFPWSRSAPTSTRLAEATSFVNAQPSSDFDPFNASVAFADSILPECAAWPDASAAPPAQAPLPNVPTLIFSGEQDLRTPTSGARHVAAMIPDSQLLLVPFTGHSVIGSDVTDCATAAISAFFAGNPVQQCAPTTNEFAPTPITPTKLSYVQSPAGLAGKPGKTLVAVLDTLVDFNRQVVGATLQADAELPSGSSFGGLRGGYARLSPTAATLHDFSFVPGVDVSGTFPIRNGALQTSTIRISGAEASGGTVRIGSSAKQVIGTLGGKRFDVTVAKVELSSVGGGEWPSGAALKKLLRNDQASSRASRLLPPQLP